MMMKRRSFRGKLVFSILLILGFFIFYSNAYAITQAAESDNELLEIKPSDSFCNDFTGSARERCKNAVKQCGKNLTNEANDYKIHATVNGQDILQYNDPKIGKYTKDKKVIVTNNGKSIKSGQKISSDRFNTVEFYSELVADITFKDNNNSDININCNGSFKKIYMFDDSTPPTTSNGFNNPSCKTGGVCDNYIKGKKMSNETLDKNDYKYNNLVGLGNATIKGKSMSFPQYVAEYFPYCDCNSNPQVNYILGDGFIKKMLASLAISFKAEYDSQKPLTTIKERDIPIVFDSDFIELKDGDSVNQSFTCTAFGPQKYDTSGANGGFNLKSDITGVTKYATIKDSETGEIIGYNNVRKFAKKGKEQKQYYKDKDGTKKAACSVQCGEEVEVTYGPPVAVKGTVCFQYYVTVKSKIKCQSKILSEKPTPPEPTEISAKTCKMKIKCNTYTGIVQSQAGPKEEFDECVKEKFNGKYTQKAINYCYKKVYKKSNTAKVNSNIDDILPQKVADNRWWCDDATLKEIDKAYPNAYQGHTIEDVWKAVMNEAKDGLRGSYESTGKKGNYGYITYVWKPTTSCRWDQYADIYKYDQVTVEPLVYDDEIFAGKRSKGWDDINRAEYRDYLYTKLYNGTRYYYETSYHQIYYFADKGAKTAHYVNTNSDCSDKCEIFTEENTNTCSIPGSTIEPKISDTTWKKYEEAIVSYEEAVSKCAANLECTEGKNKTTTYTMGANECTKVDSNGKCTKWKESSCTDRNESGACKNWKTSKICKNGAADKNCQNEWDKPSCILWNEKKEKEDGIDVFPPADDVKNPPYIILKNAIGICYGKTETNYHYINRISFPGTYIEPIKKSVHRNPDCDGQDVYSFQKNSFCVDPALPNINTKWWKWDQGEIESENKDDIYPRNQSWKNKHISFNHKAKDTLGEEYDLYTEPDADYNIKGVIENFGYLGWNIDVSCFYAINNDTPDIPKIPDDPGKTKTTIENVDTKPISLTDLFPSSDDTTKNENVKDVSNTKKSDEIIPKKLKSTKKDETGTVVKVANEKEETGRTPGYNWTCDATDTRIKSTDKNVQDYIVAPVALRKKIEKDGDQVTSNESELDYRIVLTSANLKEIKKYNKDNEDKNGYYSLDVIKKEKAYKVGDKDIKIAFYESKFLKNETYVSKIEKPMDFYCNNFKDGKCDNKLTDASGQTWFKNSGCEKENK